MRITSSSTLVDYSERSRPGASSSVYSWPPTISSIQRNFPSGSHLQQKMLLRIPFTLSCLFTTVYADSFELWCGKYYQVGSPTTPPLSSDAFPIPALSSTPLLAFSCSPSVRPYLDGESTATILLDAPLSYQRGSSFTGSSSGNLTVTIAVSGQSTGSQPTYSIPVNSTSNEAALDLTKLTAQSTPYTIECTAKDSSGNLYQSSSSLYYLPPNPYGGSTVKMDQSTGGLLVPDSKGAYEPFFPMGFFTQFDNYLTGTNYTAILDQQLSMGINVVHPTPPYDDLNALNNALDHMEQIGMWLMYDMRWTYTNTTAVQNEVNMFKNRTNLLLWYTADEPDGSADDEEAGPNAYDAIYAADGYHPVSLVLNCADFKWSTYSAGSDVLMMDPYPLYVNTSFSNQYDTICNSTYGCCGCDDCKGDITDISDRLDAYYERRELEGRARNMTMWVTLEAFGGQFWTSTPTGQEYLAMSVLSISHGATGIISWTAPTTDEILASTKTLSDTLPTLNSYILSSESSFSRPSANTTSLDVALWTRSTSSLVIVVNLLNSTLSASATLPFTITSTTPVLDSGTISSAASKTSINLTLEPFGVVAWTFSHAAIAASPSSGSVGGGGATTSAGAVVPAAVVSAPAQSSRASRRFKLPWAREL